MDSGHPYVEVARRLTEAFAARDRSTIGELIAEECIWRVPGDNVLSGVYVGRPAVLELFGRIRSLFDGPIQFDMPGRWLIRFHVYHTCLDLVNTSPHGHAAFFLNVP